MPAGVNGGRRRSWPYGYSSRAVAQSAQGHEPEREREAAPQPLTVTSAAKELSTLVLLFVAAPDPEELLGVVEAAAED